MLGVLVIFGFEILQKWSIGTGFSWVFAYLLQWIIILLVSFLLARSLFKNLNSHFRIWLPILAFLILPGAFFAVNPVYQGDFNKRGLEKDISENQILTDVFNAYPDFTGFVCVASPSCPYCVEAVRTKIKFIHKREKIQTLVYLGAGDESIANQFKDLADAPDVNVVLNSNPESGIQLGESVIPVFIFIRDGKIVHLWRNEQLGYPALDWIESGLK